MLVSSQPRTTCGQRTIIRRLFRSIWPKKRPSVACWTHSIGQRVSARCRSIVLGSSPKAMTRGSGASSQICQVVRSGRAFLRRMLDLLHAVHRPPNSPLPIRLNVAFRAGGSHLWSTRMEGHSSSSHGCRSGPFFILPSGETVTFVANSNMPAIAFALAQPQQLQ